MNKITKRLLSVEREHFNRLSIDAKQLIIAFFFFNIIAPIFGIFTNAFLWRQSQDVITLAVFNLATFLALPIGFYLNGHLLQKFLPSRLFLVGLSMQALVTAALIFFPAGNYYSILTYGMLIGLSAGLLWSNRSLLVLRITLSENRIYFASLDSTINMLLGIIVPLTIGSFIVFGQSANLYSPMHAYYALSFLMFVVIFFIFKRVKEIDTKLPQLNEILLENPSKNWQKMRVFTFIFGLLSGLMGFIPVVMILSFIGKEDALGTVQSLSAVVAAIIIYFIAKKVTKEQRLWIIGGSIIFSILGSLTFSLFYSQAGVFAFFAFQALAIPLGGIGYITLYYDLIEKENETKAKHYAHIFDSEIFINSGRIIGILTFLLTIHFFSQNIALRYILLFFAIIQILLFKIAKSIEKSNKATVATEQIPQII